MEFIKIRECLSVCVSFRHCCVSAVNVCVPVRACACVCVLNPHLPAIAGVVFVVVAAGQVQPLAKMSACCSYTHRHTDTQTHAHTDTVTANWFAHSHTDTAKGFMLCCAVPWGGDFSAVAVVAVVVVAFLLALI